MVMTCTLSVHGQTALFETCHVCALSVHHTCMTMQQSLPHTTLVHIDESMTNLHFPPTLKSEIIDASYLCGLDEPSVAHYGYGMFLFQATHDQHIKSNKKQILYSGTHIKKSGETKGRDPGGQKPKGIYYAPMRIRRI